MTTLALARNAMATRFEIVLHGRDAVRLRAAGEAALDEIDRLEAQLSLYRPSSEIATVNARAAHEPVRVSAETFRLLEAAMKFTAETDGAFDITIAPLVRAWGFMGGSGHPAAAAELAAARQVVGTHLVQLDEKKSTVRFAQPGVMLDLGAIGKGHAVGCAADLLRESGVASALVHGGTSTVYAIGKPPGAGSWKLAVNYPENSGQNPPQLASIELCDEALSMSAVWGRSFESGGRQFGHVIDPRTGEPSGNALLSVIVTRSATDSDALSTALLVGGRDGFARISQSRPGLRALLVAPGREGKYAIQTRGIEVLRPQENENQSREDFSLDPTARGKH